MNIISTETLSIWLDLRKNISSLESQIIDRINYIVRKIYEIFDDGLYWWDFPGDGIHGEGGSLINSLNPDEIIFQAESSNYSKNKIIILQNGEERILDDGFPRRWLFENFEEEVTKGKEKFEEIERKRLQDKKGFSDSQKIEDQKLIENIKKKLSKKELIALQKSFKS